MEDFNTLPVYDSMPREELIAEIEAWREKFGARVEQESERITEEAREVQEERVKIIEDRNTGLQDTLSATQSILYTEREISHRRMEELKDFRADKEELMHSYDALRQKYYALCNRPKPGFFARLFGAY